MDFLEGKAVLPAIPLGKDEMPIWLYASDGSLKDSLCRTVTMVAFTAEQIVEIELFQLFLPTRFQQSPKGVEMLKDLGQKGFTIYFVPKDLLQGNGIGGFTTEDCLIHIQPYASHSLLNQ